MRLRFGKKDMWTVSQRSIPSLRLRFGKRSSLEPVSNIIMLTHTKIGLSGPCRVLLIQESYKFRCPAGLSFGTNFVSSLYK